jgi:IQ calmodulin-binding motif
MASPQTILCDPYDKTCTANTARPSIKAMDTNIDVSLHVSFRTAARRFSNQGNTPSPVVLVRPTIPTPKTTSSIPKQHIPWTTSSSTNSTGPTRLPTMVPLDTTSTVVATTKFYTATAATTTHKESEFLTNHKVFQKRYNTMATTIQRIYRGHVQRQNVQQLRAVCKIQRMIRHSKQRREEQVNSATIQIQTIFRGWAIRQRAQVYQLEHQLCQIEKRRVRELNEIQEKRESELQRINESIGKEQVQYIQLSQKLQATIEQANTIILCLRKENKKIRDRNDTLHTAIQQLIEENEMLERQAQEYKIFASNLDRMMEMNDENVALADIVDQCEQRQEQFLEAIERRDEFIMHENQIGRLYLNQIQRMVVLLEESSDDLCLVAFIEELCLKCNLPGTGLEAEDAMDMSERKVSKKTYV